MLLLKLFSWCAFHANSNIYIKVIVEVALGWVQTRIKNQFMAVRTNALDELVLDILHM